ncbi:MAG: ABC transporter permease [Actinoplanes sp.]
MTSWAPALRIAWRDARKNKGRSLLVLSMIALPVLALSYGAATYDMFTLTPQESYAREAGSAQAALVWRSTTPILQDWRGRSVETVDGDLDPPGEVSAEKVLGFLPAGSTVVPYDEGTLILKTAQGVGSISAFATDAADPLARGLVGIVDGAAPRDENQIAVTEAAAQRIGVRTGDEVSTPDGKRSWQVTGVAEFPADLGERVLFAVSHLPAEAESPQPTRWLARTPRPVTWQQVTDLNERGVSVASRAVYANPPESAGLPAGGTDDRGSQAFSVALLAGGLGVLEIVLLAGPAFAVGARRKQRDLALVAANGGTPAHLRRIVLADGIVLGALGALAGTAIGLVAAMLARPYVETALLDVRAGGYRVFPLALLGIAVLAVGTGVLAALVPAFTAGRLHVVEALTGRAGTTRSRRLWIVVGLGCLAAGAAVGGYGAITVSQTSILIGVVALEAGLVLCTPALIGLLGRLGHLLPLAARISIRDTSRNRASAAPAISAVMAAVAASVALGVYYTNDNLARESKYRPAMPVGAAYVDLRGAVPSGGVAAVGEAMASALPLRKLVEVKGYACAGATSPEDYCSLVRLLPADQRCFVLDLDRPATADQQRRALRDRRCDQDSGRVRTGDGAVENVGDGDFLSSVIQVSARDQAQAGKVLAAGGVVVRDPRYVRDGKIKISIRDSRKPGSAQNVPDEKLPSVTAPAYVLSSGIGAGDLTVYSPRLLERVGLRTVPAGLIAIPNEVPDQAQEDRLRAVLLPISADASRYAIIERGAQDRANPLLLVAAAVAALITLGAAGIATGLAAADGKADLTTLAAVGASPGLRRRLSLTQAGVIAGLGSLLGVVAGGTAVLAVLVAHNRATAGAFPAVAPYPLAIAWSNVTIALVVPLVAMAGAGLLTRSRLPTERPVE